MGRSLKERKLRVQVTERDVRRGETGSISSCPVARAVRRELDWKRTVVVGGSFLDVGCYETAELPEAVRKFIRLFDFHGEGKPFSFSVTLRPLRPLHRARP
jgi:hypothetical protein